MRILFVAALALVASLSTASAQMMSCYIEGTVGAGVATATVKDSVTGDRLALASNGMLAAPGAGCDFHISEFVLGGFGRYDFGKTSTTIASGGTTLAAHFDNPWLIAARLGYKVNPATTVYGFAGYSGMSLDLNATDGIDSMSTSIALRGISAGAGIEFMVGGPWSVKADYTFTNINTKTVDTDVTLDPHLHQVRVGVAYRFLP